MHLSAALLAAALLLAAGHRRAFAKDFLERSDLSEIHVARGAAQSPIRPDVVGPEEISQQLVGLGGERFERQQMVERALLVRAGVRAQRNELRLLTRNRVGNAIFLEAEIVRCLGLECDLFESRKALVAARKSEFQVGRAVLERFDDKLRRDLIRAPGVIDQLQFVLSVLFDRKLEAINIRVIGVGGE